MTSEALKDPADNRRLERKELRIPVKLEVVESNASSAKVFLAYTSNINRRGIGLNVSAETPMSLDSRVVVSIDGHGARRSYRVPAKLMWHANSQCGLQFLDEVEDIHEILQKITPPFDLPFAKKFYPYVGDEDVDTQKYEFFPYADKFVAEFKKTREYLMQLKRGQVPPEAHSYIYAQYAVADSDLNRAAVMSAHRAFQEFRRFSVARRRKILDDIRDLLQKEKENLIELLVIEGHPRKLAEWEYSGMLVAISRESLDHFEKEMMQSVGQHGQESIIMVRRPHGVVCVSPPRNASSVAFMACLALLAGNTLVIKPPLQMPISSIYMWRNIFGRVLRANGAPKGTVNVVVGNSKQFLEAWLENPCVRCIFFFGDSEMGLEVGKRVFEKGKKPILELAGNDFLVVWKDAPLEQAADSLLDAFMGSTQICMVPKKALIHEDVYARFVEIFLQKVKTLKVGLPSDPETILSPVGKIPVFYEHLEDAVKKGARMLTGGYRINHRGERDENGLYIMPTVLEVPVERAYSMRCVAEENFFPLLPLIRVSPLSVSGKNKDHNIFETMMGLLEANEYGLRISVWVRDPYYLRRFIEDTHHSGLLRINSRHINFSPYLSTNGGIGKSGGPYGEMNHVWQKTSHLQGISVTRLELEGSPGAHVSLLRKEGPDEM